MTWRIRWFLIIAITIAYTFALIGGLIGFGITKDPHYGFFCISPRNEYTVYGLLTS